MSLKSRIDKVEEQVVGKDGGFMTVMVPYSLNYGGDDEARRDYMEKHYPETKGFNGLLVMVTGFSDVLV